ncbi:sigma-70 family RNA polymerase sigma factor [Corallococcus sp. AB049A]|uniref:Sigma-70 family RNA polymerase sigma factor n=1 Tax=Corallococcus interemptor TaxID=2316720 RepID=A0A3A8R9B0_9BACT|nr:MULTISPECIES: sigma-70 family RNA polymerase sigma factor [Corallococcus]RKH71964.1 sigma-70 family RNA polymerase sigma factor [Corallococcus interemptor]RKI51190.1 sigma-70 family RNA polymerase sigma factor [Corallococcus sp. AB049A]
MDSQARGALGQAAREHERFLWGLCYRMTGVAADADDLVQDVYARALATPPERLDLLRPWLTRVAVNLARDHLRRRRREGYVGPWLPSPVETGDEEVPPSMEARLPGGGSTEGRYELLESVSFAFLLALEALSPKQRAVLLLRDVFDYSVLEVAEALRMSEANVKVVHHRARAAMAAYDQARCVPTRDMQARTRAALEAFLGALVTGDVAAAEALLASDVRALTDGGGKSRAALVPILGPQRVVLFVRRLMEMRSMPIALEMKMLNGLPAMVVVYPPAKDPMLAMHTVMRVDLDADGRIHALHSIVVDRKLSAVRMPVPE